MRYILVRLTPNHGKKPTAFFCLQEIDTEGNLIRYRDQDGLVIDPGECSGFVVDPKGVDFMKFPTWGVSDEKLATWGVSKENLPPPIPDDPYADLLKSVGAEKYDEELAKFALLP